MIIRYTTNFLKYIFFLFFNLINKKQFIILTPGFLGFFFKKMIIFDKKKKILFSIKIRNYFDIVTVFEIFGYDNYSLRKFEIYKKINIIENSFKKNKLRPLIIDCGANIGCSSIYFNKTYENSFIISVEPDDNNFNILEENCNSNSFKNICSAISSKQFNFDVFSESNDNRSFKVRENIKGVKKSITVNELLDNYHLNYKPFLIKFDVEGFEKNIFSENLDWIRKFKIIIIEIHDWMLPGEEISGNFINAISNLKKDVLIKGENIILINYNYLD